MDLTVESLTAGYLARNVLQGVTLTVSPGEIVAVLGPNGAGKTTLLRCLIGLHPVRSGAVAVGGNDVTNLPADKVARRGVALVPEGRQLFGGLSIQENLRVAVTGCVRPRDRTEWERRLREIWVLFPQLEGLDGRPTSTLSSGEQQMLAIARAVIRQPRVLLLDEPSQGLAPRVVVEVFGLLDHLRKAGVSILLVEQHAAATRQVADRILAMEGGRLVPRTGNGPAQGSGTGEGGG